MAFMEYFNYNNIKDAQAFVDLVNDGESLDDTTTHYCEVENVVNRIGLEEVEVIGYKVIKDEITLKYITE